MDSKRVLLRDQDTSRGVDGVFVVSNCAFGRFIRGFWSTRQAPQLPRPPQTPLALTLVRTCIHRLAVHDRLQCLQDLARPVDVRLDPPQPLPVRDLALSWAGSYMPADPAEVDALLDALRRALAPGALDALALASGWKTPRTFLPALGALVRGPALATCAGRLDLGIVLGELARAGEDTPGERLRMR